MFLNVLSRDDARADISEGSLRISSLESAIFQRGRHFTIVLTRTAEYIYPNRTEFERN